MRISPLLLLIIGSLLLSCAVAPVQADSIQELAQGASVDLLGFDITGAKPAYQKTSQDWINEGNAAKARCEYKSAQYNERVLAYVETSSTDPEVIGKWKNPSADQRRYLMSTGFHVKDQEAGRLYSEMTEACVAADKAYSKAYELTAEDDYAQHAEIFDEAAGVYDALGNEESAEDVRDAADIARGHAAANTYLPLPWWLAVLAVISTVLILHRTRR